MKILSPLAVALLPVLSATAVPSLSGTSARPARQVFSSAPASGHPVAVLKARRTDEIPGSNWTVGCETLDRGLCVFASYRDFLPRLGVKRIRLQGGWARCERERGVYDFSWLDEPVDFCRTNGMSVLLETSYGNPIYAGAGGWDLGAGFPMSEGGLAAWDRWVEALARHFRGRVTDWAMWNEPDFPGKTVDTVPKTPDAIAAFNVRTAKIVKRIIPDARISALSLAHNDPELLENCLVAMKDDLDLFESVIYHGYSANPDDSYDKVEEQKRVLAKYAPHLRLVQGENGAPSTFCTAYALRNIPWNELSQAKWDVRRMLGDLGHDVASSVFTIMEYAQAGRPLNTKGLLERTKDMKVKRIKPAFGAVRNVASVFDSTVVRERTTAAALTGPRPAVNVYTAPGGRIVAYWDASSRPDETRHSVPGDLTLPGAALVEPVLVDLVTGDVFAVDLAKVEATADGTVYRGVPVHDYPWLLASKAALRLDPGEFMGSDVPSAETVGRQIVRQFLSTDPTAYNAKGFTGKVHNGTYVPYAVVSLWVNALEFARKIGDGELERTLLARVEPFLPGGAKADRATKARHVDFSVFGALPLEKYILDGDKKALAMGLHYADRQWEPPQPGDLDEFPKFLKGHFVPVERQLAYLKDGYSGETRLWIDDMYMISLLQTQAYRATGDKAYVRRAAKEMCLYLDKLQLADGLFHHAADVPFVWGRGDGWMAAGMPMILRHLDGDDPSFVRILAGYRKMMAALLKWQRADGLWGQLVTDSESWSETSGSAMFAYGMLLGVKRGWLDRAAYTPAVERAWRTLVRRIDADGNLADICIGTGAKNDRQYYLDRSRLVGDPHGQAALLWLVNELTKVVRSLAPSH